MLNLNIIKYCAEEVRRQGDTPLHVAYMCEAWEWAMSYLHNEDIVGVKNYLTAGTVQAIGKLVEPMKNVNGFRQVSVRVGNSVKMDWRNVEQAMNSLFSYNSLLDYTSEQIYNEFQEIHPFRDGNGRTGKVIYNALKGTLNNPIWPPNFWNVSNP